MGWKLETVRKEKETLFYLKESEQRSLVTAMETLRKVSKASDPPVFALRSFHAQSRLQASFSMLTAALGKTRSMKVEN